MDQRQFEIKLGLLIMEALAEGLRQDDLIAALNSRRDEEMRLKESRRRTAASY